MPLVQPVQTLPGVQVFNVPVELRDRQRFSPIQRILAFPNVTTWRCWRSTQCPILGFPGTMADILKVRNMRKILCTTVAGFLLMAASLPLVQAQQAKQPPAPMKLKVGDMAPDFKLKYFDGAKVQDISLSDFKGKKNVALAFFVLAFTGG
jgi:hypothetical protein